MRIKAKSIDKIVLKVILQDASRLNRILLYRLEPEPFQVPNANCLICFFHISLILNKLRIWIVLLTIPTGIDVSNGLMKVRVSQSDDENFFSSQPSELKLKNDDVLIYRSSSFVRFRQFFNIFSKKKRPSVVKICTTKFFRNLISHFNL